MPEKQKILSYDYDGTPVTITVARATARKGMQRYQMMVKGDEANKTEPDEALATLRLITYPDCVSGTEQITGLSWPLSFDEFVDLPEELVDMWAVAVYEINPHWLPTKPPETTESKQAAEKKSKT